MRRLASVLAAALVSGLAVLATLGLFELALRSVPALLPAGAYGAGGFDPELRMNVHVATAIYNKVRFEKRSPNRAGFMDVEHEITPAPGVIRIGFFGDSYVEALQVPLDQTYFRRLPSEIAGEKIEPLAFGISGWGTLNAWIAERVLGDRYGLDAVVYVFVENDPGDQLDPVQRVYPSGDSVKPTATLSDAPPGFEVHWHDPEQRGALHRFAKWVQRRSLLGQVVSARITALRAAGVRVTADRRAEQMTEAASGDVPSANDLASTWPPAMREQGAELWRRVLRQFRDDVRAKGRDFLVVYVPLGEDHAAGRVEDAVAWRPLVLQTCAELGIPLVDLKAPLGAGLARGERMFDDHFTPEGHAVVAHEIAEALAERIRGGAIARAPSTAPAP